MFAFMFMMLACGPGDGTGTDTSPPDADVPDPKTGEGCTHHLRVNGQTLDEAGNARVGESWTVLLWCDNILEQGPSVLRINPANLATIDSSDPILTFVRTGEGLISMQVGTMSAEEFITVQD